MLLALGRKGGHQLTRVAHAPASSRRGSQYVVGGYSQRLHRRTWLETRARCDKAWRSLNKRHRHFERITQILPANSWHSPGPVPARWPCRAANLTRMREAQRPIEGAPNCCPQMDLLRASSGYARRLVQKRCMWPLRCCAHAKMASSIFQRLEVLSAMKDHTMVCSIRLYFCRLKCSCCACKAIAVCQTCGILFSVR